MKDNADVRLRAQIGRLQQQGLRPRILVHCCCAPCSSHVLTLLAQGYACTAYYENSNIAPPQEYRYRLDELRRFLSLCPECADISLTEGAYDPAAFLRAVAGHEDDPEGGERCTLCYAFRLRRTAQAARAGGYEAFTTTLSVSPYKHADRLNRIGAALAQEYGVPFIPADFKKNDGYQRSIRLSREYDLYRQDYCGCPFSLAERERREGAGT